MYISILIIRKREAQVQSQPPVSATDSQDTQMQLDAPPTDSAAPTRKRPRIDLTIEPRERKRGKTAFGLLVGTLTKAKSEDQERNASEAVRLLLSQVRGYIGLTDCTFLPRRRRKDSSSSRSCKKSCVRRPIVCAELRRRKRTRRLPTGKRRNCN